VSGTSTSWRLAAVRVYPEGLALTALGTRPGRSDLGHLREEGGPAKRGDREEGGPAKRGEAGAASP